jgi:hypothetical protein
MAVFEDQNQVIFNMTVFSAMRLAVMLPLAFGIQNCRFWNTESKSFFSRTPF